MESEPIKITLKDRKQALRLGNYFSRELGITSCRHFILLISFFLNLYTGCGENGDVSCLYSKA